MTAAYLDPFAHIVDLHRTATGYAILIAEFPANSFSDGSSAVPTISYTNPEEPIPTFSSANRSLRVGEVRIWNIDLLTLTNTQIARLTELLLEHPDWDDPGIPGAPPGPYGWIGTSGVFATQELALADKLGVSSSVVHRRSRVGDAYIISYALVTSPATYDYVYYEAINIPMHQLLFSAQSVQSGWWDYEWYGGYKPKVRITSGPLNAALPPIAPYSTLFDTSKGLISTNNKSLLRFNSFGTLIESEVFVDGQTFVVATTAGESLANTQRTAALPYEATVTYPGDLVFLVTELTIDIPGSVMSAGANYSTFAASSPYTTIDQLDVSGTTTVWKVPRADVPDLAALLTWYVHVTDALGSDYWTTSDFAYAAASLSDMVQFLAPGAVQVGTLSTPANVIMRAYSDGASSKDAATEMIVTNCAAFPLKASTGYTWPDLNLGAFGVTSVSTRYNVPLRAQINGGPVNNAAFRDVMLDLDGLTQDVALLLGSWNYWAPSTRFVGTPSYYATGSYLDIVTTVPAYTGIPEAIAARDSNTIYATTENYHP